MGFFSGIIDDFRDIGKGIGKFVGGTFDRITGRDIDKQNLANQEAMFEYQKWVTENSHQIASKDRQAAGLSIHGGSTGAQSQVTQAPQSERNKNRIAMMMARAAMGKTLAEGALLRATRDKIRSDTRLSNARVGLTNEQTILTNFQAQRAQIDANWAQRMNQQTWQLRKHHVDKALFDAVNAKLTTSLTRLGIEGKELDNALKALTIEIQDWNFAYYKDKNVPTDIGWDQVTRYAAWFAGIIEEGLEKGSLNNDMSLKELSDFLNTQQKEPSEGARQRAKIIEGRTRGIR